MTLRELISKCEVFAPITLINSKYQVIFSGLSQNVNEHSELLECAVVKVCARDTTLVIYLAT